MGQGSGGRVAAWAVVGILLVSGLGRVVARAGGDGRELLGAGAVEGDAAPTASGYLMVNESSGARMYFAYYEAEESGGGGYGEADEERPILLWLQGGMGCSGMVANFYTIGPWLVGEDQKLDRNPGPWNRLFGVLFVDQPGGAGFSIAPSILDIPTDQHSVCVLLYSALQSFFLRFPSLRRRPFFVAGSSYAGKYVPSIADFILSKQLEYQQLSLLGIPSLPPLRLDGIAIGNGLIDPIAQVPTIPHTAYQMGVIDEAQRSIADELVQQFVSAAEEQDWLSAASFHGAMFDYLQNVSGLATLGDVRRPIDYCTTPFGANLLSAFLNQAEVQAFLNAEFQKWESCNSVVSKRMTQDIAKSTKPLVEALLNRSIPVLLYQGQFDLTLGVAACEAWIRLLQWDGLDDFYAAERHVWKENGVLAGYVRSFSSLTHVVVSNAGHDVAADQHYASQRMIEGWISRQQGGLIPSNFSAILSTPKG